jgi:hypothetical protein
MRVSHLVPPHTIISHSFSNIQTWLSPDQTRDLSYEDTIKSDI